MVRHDLRDIRRILTATDLSQESVGAVTLARKLSQKFGAALHAVHAIEPLQETHEKTIPGLAEAHFRQAREELGKFAASHGLDRDVTLHIARGRAADEVVRLGVKLQADLLVIGRFGHGGLKRGILGSIADSLVRLFPESVLVVPPEYRGKLDRIGAAADFSEDSWLGVRRAAELAIALPAKGEMPIYHCFTLPVGYDHLCSYEEAVQRLAAAHAQEGKEFTDRLARELPAAKARVRIEQGSPGKTVARLAAEDKLELLVLSAHARTRSASAIMDATTESVIRAAPCSVWAEKSGIQVQTLLDAVKDLFR